MPITQVKVMREEGESLSPARFGPREIADMKKTMGSRTFVAQCQQDPTAEAGNILKRQWWKRWKELPSGFDIMVTSWDMAFKETQAGSYVVGQVWARRGSNFYLIDQVRQRMDFSETLVAFENLAKRYPLATGHLVEDKANGPAIMSALQNRISGIIAVEPQGSKIARAQAVSPIIEAGNVHIPDENTCGWVLDFVEECAGFRGEDGEINDQVDTATQAIHWLSQARAFTKDDLVDDRTFVDDDDTIGGFNE
jgi:predicted phage terminase large subunit-like protein